MGVGLDADTEYLSRGSIPSGGAGTLSDGAFKNTFQGIWLYRPSSGNSHGGTSGGRIIRCVSGAREISLGYDNTFGSGTAADPLLQVVFNSGGGTGSVQTYASANFLDEWVFYFILDNSTSGQIAGYIRLSDLTTAVTITRANDNAGSQYINTLQFGGAGGTDGVFGHYAYGRARYATGITVDNVKAWAASSAPDSDWGFWPIADNTDTGDDSGNGRDLTFTGTLTSESSPTLSSGGTTHTKTLNDGFVVNDAQYLSRHRGRSHADACALVDAFSLNRHRGRHASEACGVGDGSIVNRHRGDLLTDSIVLADGSIVSRYRGRVQQSTVNLVDQLLASRYFTRVVNEFITVIDAFLIGAREKIVLLSDFVSVVDSALLSRLRGDVATDEVMLTDQELHFLSRSLRMSEQVTVVDQTIVMRLRVRDLIDAFSVIDAAAATISQQLPQTPLTIEVRVRLGTVDPVVIGQDARIRLGQDDAIKLGGYN